MKKIIFNLMSLVLVFGLINIANAEINSITPSTNDINKTKGWAHVNQIDADTESVTFEFVSERNLDSCFEYRTDGDTSQASGANHNADVTDGLYPFYCMNNNSRSEKIEADEYVEVRMVFGGESDERFDWTRFDVVDNIAPMMPTGLTRYAPDEKKYYECGELSQIQRMWPEWDDNIEDDFSHYEYSSFNPDSQGIDERVFYISEFHYSGNWLPNDGTYGFAVRAVDKAGNKSDWALSSETLEGSCQITYDSTLDDKNIDCKDGRWATWTDPVFKNQGDCVSWLQSSDKENGNRKNN